MDVTVGGYTLQLTLYEPIEFPASVRLGVVFKQDSDEAPRKFEKRSKYVELGGQDAEALRRILDAAYRELSADLEAEGLSVSRGRIVPHQADPEEIRARKVELNRRAQAEARKSLRRTIQDEVKNQLGK